MLQCQTRSTKGGLAMSEKAQLQEHRHDRHMDHRGKLICKKY